MTLRHLKTFLCVAETGSITDAAKRLYVSQPSVSLTIKELEEYYGVKLFERLNKKIQITEAGKLFQNYASHFMRMFGEMESAVKNCHSLRIGSSITLGTRYIPAYVKEFRGLHPQVTVKVEIASSSQIETGVLSGELDLGLIEGTVHSEHLISHAFMQDTLIPICSAKIPTPTTLSDFLQNSLLLREKGSGTRELFDDKMDILGITVDPAWESTSNEALINGVLNGNGVSVLSQKLVQTLIDEGQLTVPDIPDLKLERSFRFLYHKNKFMTEPMKQFLSLIQNNKGSSAA